MNTHQKTKTAGRAIEAALRELYRSGQHQTLQAIIDRELRAPDVLAAKRQKRLENDNLFTDLKLRRPLWASLRGLFGEPEPVRNTQRARYWWSAQKLERLSLEGAVAPLGKRSAVRELERVEWDAVLDAWPDSEADCNHMRRMLSRALTLLLGDTLHPARRAILKRIPRAREPRGGRRGELSLPRFLEIIAKVPEDKRAPYWTLLITGMRTGEYLRCGPEHLRPDIHMVYVPGRKTEGSAAMVAVDPTVWHLVASAIPAPRAYRWLRIHWKRAARAAGCPGIRLHDIRHLTANAGLAGGPSLADVQALMRHDDPSRTMLYAAIDTSRRAAKGIAKMLPMPARQRSKRGRTA